MKPLGPVFDAEWRRRCEVAEIPRDIAAQMIGRHYLRRWPGTVVLFLGLREGWDYLGVIVFSLPPRETEKRYGGKVWELSRLWIRDEVPQNAETFFISRAVKHIRKNFSDVKALVSYADPSVGHEGIIYRAANWRADGRTDGDRKTPRFDYSDCEKTATLFGEEGRLYRRRGHAPPEVIRVPRISKYRFVYRLV